MKHPANQTAHLAEYFQKLCNKMEKQITNETTHGGNVYFNQTGALGKGHAALTFSLRSGAGSSCQFPLDLSLPFLESCFWKEHSDSSFPSCPPRCWILQHHFQCVCREHSTMRSWWGTRPSSRVMAGMTMPSSQSDSRITQFSQLHGCIITVYRVFVQSRCLPKHLRVSYKHWPKTTCPALPLRSDVSAMKCYGKKLSFAESNHDGYYTRCCYNQASHNCS